MRSPTCLCCLIHQSKLKTADDIVSSSILKSYNFTSGAIPNASVAHIFPCHFQACPVVPKSSFEPPITFLMSLFGQLGWEES
jgi:hypothetical protein